LIFLGIVIVILCGLWIFLPMLYGSPWVPNFPGRIRKALGVAGVRPGEVVYDLGAGDGRVLLIAARDFGAVAVGIEIEPAHCAVIWLRALFAGLRSRISVQCRDFYQASLADADVVFVYLTSRQIGRLKRHLERQLRPGTRVVSIASDFDGWQPQEVDAASVIFLYCMHPIPGSLETYLAQKKGLPPAQSSG
jgi:SAM-dependent methyltransferase